MEDKLNVIAPKLRFKEFNKDWNVVKLGDICSNFKSGETITSKDIYLTGKYPVYGGNGLRGYTDRFTHDGFYLLIGRQGALCGNINRISDKSFISEHAIAVATNENSDTEWLSHKLKYFNLNRLSESSAQPGLSVNKLVKIKISIPSLPEQQKIASFLSAVDEKIQLLSRKKELLNQYKKGVMQQLFSGKLRFKDEQGKDFPEWEKRIIGDVCVCMDNLRKPLNDSQRQLMQGDIPYWGANKIMDYVNDFLFDETIILLAEDGGNFNEYETRPIANLSRGKCWVNNHTHVLKGKKNLSNEFLFYSLVHKNITGFVSGGTRAKLNKSEMLKIPIAFPTLDEQKKIANYLSNIDSKIVCLYSQISQTHTFKKGLLQQMFV